MPELPEVETVKNVLKKDLIGRRIINIKILYSNIIENLDYFNNIINQEFIDIKRRGKYLIFELNDYYLVSHLRMEGKYFIKDKDSDIIKHEHIIFYLDNNITLRYHDTRKFGRMVLLNKDELDNYLDSRIGLEPFSDKLNYLYLKDKMDKRKIKEILLDQSIIAGIGNIYADEILFASSINPNRLGITLNKEELENIINNTRIILNEAIKLKGTTIRSYTSSLGVFGEFQDYLKVHKREGLPCLKCNSIILKTRVGGRGTYYCPKCQEEIWK